MNRRRFVSAALVGLASAATVGQMPKPAEASEAPNAMAEADLYAQGYLAGLHQQVRGLEIDLVPPPVLTFEAMQADCERRGCRLEWRGQPFDGPAVPTHTQSSGLTGENADTRPFYAVGAPLTVVDAWRQSLHGEG